MLVRGFALAFALVCAVPAPAFAQETPAPQAAATTEETAQAMRDVYQALFFDSGLFDAMAADMTPTMRTAITTAPFYQNANARHRAALDAVAADAFNIVRREIVVECGLMADEIAPRVAPLMSREELVGVAQLFRDPTLSPLMRRLAHATAAELNGGKPSGDPDLTAEEQARMDELQRTPVGQAITRHGDAFMSAVQAELDAATPRIGPRIGRAFQTAICDALEEECPESLRTALGQT